VDLALLAGTSDAGVVENDYQAIIGLTSSLEQQIIATTSGVNAIPASLAGKASRFGSTFQGYVVAQAINNDRPYYDSSFSIYGPSTVSYFSPANPSGFSTGAQYKLGPIFASSVTISGFNFNGAVKPWSNYFVRYKQCAQFTQASTSEVKKAPLYLAPPSSIPSNKVWLDAEYSGFVLSAGGAVEQWQDVLGRASAAQSIVANRPVLTTNLRYDKPGIVFDGTNDYLIVNPTTDLAFGTNNFTIEMWARFSSLPTTGNYELLWDQRPSSGNGAYPAITLKGSTLVYYANTNDRITSSTVATNTWYHIATVYENNVVKFYVDGVFTGQSNTGNWNAGNSTPAIGRWFNGSFPFRGKISYGKVYSKAITGQEVLDDFNEKKVYYGK
jgi:hypothetical protein